MGVKTNFPQEQQQGIAPQQLIRKLTTDKAVKTHRQQTKEKAATADEISNIKLSGRGIKTIESLDLPSLRRLDLSRNNLNRLKGLQGCPQITYLTAAGNELTGEGLDGVRPLRDLKVFNASGNHVRRIPPSVFAQFRQLQALVLNNNEISEVPPTWFKKGLLCLNTLVLSHNKVKSLSDAGLGRLEMLTKLSVSHNMLSELPDLSACSALEELRAAHNLISQVPASLGKNVALRTLDLGHNNIEGWGALERVGKTLKSLVQVTLAGNPLCVDDSPGTIEAAGTSAEDEDADGGYETKLRSLFPGLKVRDGKRILMKKSHTYYEQRAAGSGNPDDHPAPTKRRPLPAETSGKAVRDQVRKGSTVGDNGGMREPGRKKSQRLKESDVTAKLEHEVGSTMNTGDTENEERSKAQSKAERRLRKAAARAASSTKEEREADDEGDGSLAPERSSGTTEKKRRHPKEDGSGALKSKKRKRRREQELPTEEASVVPGENSEMQHSPKQAVVDATAGATEATKKHGKKKVNADMSTKAANVECRPANTDGGSRDEQDAYSSSEELPIPGERAKQGAHDAAGKAIDAKSAARAGDPESGVVGVVVSRKRSRAKGSKKKTWQSDTTRVSDEFGESRDDGGFSVGAMLEARGQRETVGSGSGVSAWD